ncbi:MAG: response regulator [Luteimonas sp.]
MSTFDLIKRLLGRKPAAVADAASSSGTKFVAATHAAERRRNHRVAAREGLRVLIIDDSATIVAVLGKMLRQNNFITAGAGDAESGIEFARSELPELIFLDIVLPGMSGFDALRQLRRDPATKQIPIIMISGNVQATEQFYVQRIGADDFMKKPFGRGDVFGHIRQLVERGRLPAYAAPPDELLVNDDAVALPDPAHLPEATPAAMAATTSPN